MERRIVILTALEYEERQVILDNINEIEILRHPDTGSEYYKGTFDSFQIYIGKSDQTNVSSAIETERAINWIKPSFIFFVGVAGGLKDVNIGDIVIGQDVYGYERGKSSNEDGVEVFKPRAKFGASSYRMQRLATSFSVGQDWTEIKSKGSLSQPKVLTGTIASGEKVNASSTSILSDFLKMNCSHALAIEMEGLGFLEACHHYPNIPSLLIRGISDLLDNKGVSEKYHSKEKAMRNVGAFLFGFIKYCKEALTETINVYDKSSSIFKEIFGIVCKLYPEGIKMNRVWQRAGGDLSFVSLSNNGYTQWLDALELLEKGGGGSITVTSLIDVLRSDFPSNNYITRISNKSWPD